MASKYPQVEECTLDQVAAAVGLYPADAYEFVQQGLGFTVQQTHGDDEPGTGGLKTDGSAIDGSAAEPAGPVSQHVSGQQLCEGLRQFALAQWGLLARAVLRRWNVTSTLDFGRIVFALIDAGQLQKTDDDTLEDFRGVFDFRTAFEAGYRIGVQTLR